MQELKFEEAHGRGRNGNIVVKSIEVYEYLGVVTIAAFSRRCGDSPPIRIELSKSDAEDLASAILDTASNL